jgi:hypothetical protein
MAKTTLPVRYTQFGKFIVIVLLPIIIILMLMLLWIGFNDPFPAIVILFVIVTLVICLFIFYKLTIQIDDTFLEFWFGTGLIRKKYRISDIELCKPVKNPMLYGIGIHLTPAGWLYNVSGRYAVELTFINKKSKVLVGTDKPEELSKTINSLLSSPAIGTEYETAFKSSGRSGNVIPTSLIIGVFLLSVIFIVLGTRDIQLKYSDLSFRIKGLYAITIYYRDIKKIDTINELPAIAARTNGYALKNTMKGNFRLKDQRKVKLFIEKGNPPYINIKTDNIELFINFREPAKTRDVYSEIKKLTFRQDIIND